MLTDLFGWYKRNLNGMSTYHKKKTIDELLAIIKMLKNDLNSKKGGNKNVG